MTTQEKLVALDSLIDELNNEAQGQYELKDCPLNHDHYRRSELLFGHGCWWWRCEFCKTVEGE